MESYPLLDWFLTEQVEEESTVQKLLGQLGHAGTDGSALLMLDRELGARSPGPPQRELTEDAKARLAGARTSGLKPTLPPTTDHDTTRHPWTNSSRSPRRPLPPPSPST